MGLSGGTGPRRTGCLYRAIRSRATLHQGWDPEYPWAQGRSCDGNKVCSNRGTTGSGALAFARSQAFPARAPPTVPVRTRDPRAARKHSGQGRGVVWSSFQGHCLAPSAGNPHLSRVATSVSPPLTNATGPCKNRYPGN